MFKNAFAVRPALLIAVLGAALAGPAMAQQQHGSGLGSAWPTDAKDVSRVPGFHAYAWVRGGVKYVQINDNAGNVLAAFATANGTFLPLPMGRESTALQTPQDTPAAAAPAAGVTVYQDESVSVTAATRTNGALLLKAAAADTCTNPVECSTHIIAR
jgi:hypothetical protein